MKEEEIRKMRLEEFVSNEIFAIGDTVSIEDGPLKGFLGTIKELNATAQKAKIATSMFGRNTDVEVEYIQIKKVDAPLPEASESEE
jgi:transcriptional antiterminator NusG